MMGNDLRQRFLDYFAGQGHTVIRSSPLVPAQDPTLLFTNAGMVQFKSVFLGEERRPYVRAVTCQKCVRAGGKHNDLENVGRTVRHHTFFEMLGNFSFGDYFKAEAVAFAWDFLTKDLGLPRDRLWATVFTDDDEAFGLWQTVAGLPKERILRLGEADNFWAMGETGPCGPCSEVHYHQGNHLPCAEERAGRRCLGPACECDRWLEIWNLVFMQFNRDAGGTLTPLPKPSIDTGMGLERTAAIMQGKSSNFETDLLWPILEAAARLARKPYGASEADDVSLRVITDHARAATFLIADGVYPSNEWRGYVLRRIMRRAMRHGQLLGLDEPFLWRAVEWVVGVMAGAYPELEKEKGRVQEVVKAEEERFAETLDTGVAKIREYVEANRGAAERVADGKFLFTLYDTYGFPLDLAQEVFQEAGWSVPQASLDAYEEEMASQRERARAGATFGALPIHEYSGGHPFYAGSVAPGQDLISFLNALPETGFLGYDTLTAPAKILAMVVGGRQKAEVTLGDKVEIILDRTPCYPESGGQQGDTGLITGRQGQAKIVDTVKHGTGLYVHRVEVTRGGLHEGEDVAVSVESPRRQGLRLHHTGTHLLHAALRKVLGTHVTQAGSLVAPDHLRFDITHGSQVGDRELEQVEELVNEKVRDNLRVDPIQTDLEQALKMGALALFGEKYGQRVRVIRIGDFSTELCGGTHLDQTGQIGLFKIVSEGAVAAGVRRLEALTGDAALQHVGREESALREAAALLRISPLEVPQRLAKLLDEQRQLEKQLETFEARLAKGRAQELVAAARQVGGIAVVAARVDGLDQEGLRAVADSVRERLGSGGICLGGTQGDKVSLVTAVSKDLTARFNAGKLIQEVASSVGGRGGGRPDLAQAGGGDPSKLDAALRIVPDWVVRSAST